MKKGILYFFTVLILLFVGGAGYFFFAGEIKNTLQFDEGRFVSIQKFIKQGKVESLSQAKLQLDLISSDFKKDSVSILINNLNETAMVNAKVCLQKKWYGSCSQYLELIDPEYKQNEVGQIRNKLNSALIEVNVTKTKNYIKERNIDKAKVYYSKIDSSYRERTRLGLKKKIFELENELFIENTLEFVRIKEFDDARDELLKVSPDFDQKLVKSVSEQISLKESLSSQINEEGAIISLVDEIKSNMNDPESFEHVETNLSEKGRVLNVTMTYRENNTYGAKVIKQVTAKLNKDGSLKKITK
ncbi:hypothetical protein [Flammeovirga kamogawensis]|uniref:Uncharacterized protein n=1 Tax=Flammeovirga kamogawensis TaxID=373891 RepID=A0ABX8GXP6_9BACT|nr:hypothetical protein [Flammeovirga kamogawensis]MBB6462847.1 hypothetical protein [Flammeovirga kamogawensis]QWG08371.1 hypothetical protein KM029_05395 [Flammeovirga kamogawensis]TRX66666.1 hypothetical protein EO216_00450 [Flammeovirga kamogawensis]